MTEPCILAIDPGLSGAVAFYFPHAPNRVAIEDMPVVGHEVETAALARMIRTMAPVMAIVEQVGPMPKDGAVSAFRFGAAYMAVRVVIASLEVPTHLILPNTWKRHFRVRGGPDGKEQARGLALRRFPASAEHFARKKDHNRAEAALLALFGAEVING